VLGVLLERVDISVGRRALLAGFLTLVRIGASLHDANPAGSSSAAAVGKVAGSALQIAAAAAVEVIVVVMLPCRQGGGPYLAMQPSSFATSLSALGWKMSCQCP
jgi:hypothetical protein